MLASGIALSSHFAKADPATTATFIHIGFLPGDDYSEVRAANNDGYFAACSSYHIDPNFGNLQTNFAARWTLAGGLQALPLLPDNPLTYSSRVFVTGTDVTPSGSRIPVYSAYKTRLLR